MNGWGMCGTKKYKLYDIFLTPFRKFSYHTLRRNLLTDQLINFMLITSIAFSLIIDFFTFV